MANQTDPSLVASLKSFSRTTGFVAILVGCVAGWMVDLIVPRGVLPGLFIIFTLLIWWDVRRFSRTDARLKWAEQELRKLNEELEHRVVERTAQLEAANRDLIKDIAERERAEQRVTILHDLNLAITSTLDLRSVLNILLDKVDLLFPSTAISVRLFNRESGELEPLASRNFELTELAENRKRSSRRRGLTQMVFETGRSMMLVDARTDPRTPNPEIFRTMRLVSYLGVPLIVRGEILGVLSFFTKEKHQFATEEVEFLTTLAGQAAIAIHNAQLFEQTQHNLEVLKTTNLALERSTNEQRALREFLSNLLVLDVHELLQKMTEQAAKLFRAEYVWLRLFDEEGKIKTRAVAGEPGVIQAMSDHGEKSTLLGRGGRMLEQRKPLVITDMAQEAGRPSRGLAVGLHGFLGAPLFGREQRPLGLLHVMTRSPHIFSQCDLDLIEQFANGAAIALENAQLFEQVRAGQEQLRSLSHRLAEAQEAERRAISRELHDEIGQDLTALKLKLDMGIQLSVDGAKSHLGEARALANELIARVRDLSLDLRPAMLDDLGLLPTLRWHFRRYTALTNVTVDLEQSGIERLFPQEVATAAYRIVQEALTNVARHSGVGTVGVRLLGNDETLSVCIEDQGMGFDLYAAQSSGVTSGLSGMRERAFSLGGKLAVESVPGSGTRVTALLPLNPTNLGAAPLNI